MSAHNALVKRGLQMTILHARTALLPEGWANDVRVEISGGRILSVQSGVAGGGIGCLVAAPVNLHSHSFQRAMAGMTERRGPGADSFWTWRDLMYRFLDHLTPDDVQTIASFVMMEMAEAGYAGVAEFHYLHHQPGGQPYGDLAEMAGRIAAAAEQTGLGLTLLPVLYERGGCDGRALGAGQVRFGNDINRFSDLWAASVRACAGLPADTVVGVAPHSLRAASAEGLRAVAGLDPKAPIHIHVAEQVAEVTEVLAHTGARPVQWLLENTDLSNRWCLIHATQMEPWETESAARSGAVAGLCPITEANLGDGIFDGVRFLAAGGYFGVGSDSNVRISLTEELRLLEYSQRLAGRGRAMLATPEKSTGRVLYEGNLTGSALAAGRNSGAIRVGCEADFLALDMGAVDLEGRQGDDILDALIFAGDDRMVTDVWSSGRHIVRQGQHVARGAIEAAYRRTMASLRGRL